MSVAARRVGSVLAALLLGCFLLPAAGRAQDPTPPSAAGQDSFALSTQTLGLGTAISFRGNQDQVSLTVPVPTGLVPASLDTTVDMPANVARGWIDVASGDATVARVDLPAAPGTNVPISIPLAGARIDRSAISLVLTVTLLPLDGVCPETWSDRSVVMRSARVQYTGRVTDPTVVADFLPPVLERLRIYVPANPSSAESQAAVDLSAAVVAHYGSQPVAVELRPLPANGVPAEPDGPFSRSMVVTKDGAPGTDLVSVPGGPPALRLSGNDNTLLDQVRLVTSRVGALAVDAKAIAGSMDQAPELARDSASFADLNIGTLTSTSHGKVRVSAVVDQNRLGRASKNLRIHLRGNYTPLPAAQAGLLTASIGANVIDSWAAEASGQIDRWVDIPDTDLKRLTTVDLTLQTTGGGNQCGFDQPLTLTLLPQSEIAGEPAGAGPPYGFQALPQALLPSFDIAANAGDFADTDRAVAIVAGLQSLTTVALAPQWRTVDEAVGSGRPAVLVLADGKIPSGIDPPLTEQNNVTLSLTTPDGPTNTITLGAGTPFASLQTAWQNGRELLLATSTGTPAELDRTLAYLHDEPGRWSSLSGDILFTAPGRDPVELSLPHNASDSPGGISTLLKVILTVAGLLLAVGVLLALLVLVRRRRSARHRG